MYIFDFAATFLPSGFQALIFKQPFLVFSETHLLSAISGERFVAPTCYVFFITIFFYVVSEISSKQQMVALLLWTG